jgi:hypothetical protein
MIECFPFYIQRLICNKPVSPNHTAIICKFSVNQNLSTLYLLKYLYLPETSLNLRAASVELNYFLAKAYCIKDEQNLTAEIWLI